MAPWLESTNPDLLLMQECRATDNVIPERLGGDWNIAHAEPTIDGHKGRAGVAVASRRPIKDERSAIGPARFDGAGPGIEAARRTGVGPARCDGSGGWIEADVVLDDGTTLTAVSTYVFTGEFETQPRQQEKYAFL